MKRFHLAEYKKPLIEFMGTFFLIFTIAIGSPALAIASMLMAWLYIGGHISGGHYNPAVSLGVAACGRLDRQELIHYIIAQVLGGFAAYFLVASLFGQVLMPHPSVAMLPAFLIEVLLAFVFVLVVLTVAVYKKFKGSSVFGFAIGFTVPALVAIGGPTSGGLFNPAIALGSRLFGLVRGMPIMWEQLFMYVVGASLGGLLAACVFKYFVPVDER